MPFILLLQHKTDEGIARPCKIAVPPLLSISRVRGFHLLHPIAKHVAPELAVLFTKPFH